MCCTRATHSTREAPWRRLAWPKKLRLRAAKKEASCVRTATLQFDQHITQECTCFVLPSTIFQNYGPPLVLRISPLRLTWQRHRLRQRKQREFCPYPTRATWPTEAGCVAVSDHMRCVCVFIGGFLVVNCSFANACLRGPPKNIAIFG